MFKIGIGPSSSHTVGPMKAALAFLTKLGKIDNVESIKTDLFGSLALTGRGHGTDKAIMLGLMNYKPETIDTNLVESYINDVLASEKLFLKGKKYIDFKMKDHMIFHKATTMDFHTNALTLSAFDKKNTLITKETYYSVGGGFIVSQKEINSPDTKKELKEPPFPFNSAKQLLEHAEKNNCKIADIIFINEKTWFSEKEIKTKLDAIWDAMKECVKNGFKNTGVLPGPLKVQRRAPEIFQTLTKNETMQGLNMMTYLGWVSTFALAVNEENANGGRVVTAPTNGAAGIVPAVLHYYDRFHSQSIPNKHHEFLFTAAAIGMLCKQNASISGAEGGCQSEVGSACAMAAAGLTAALGGTNLQIENAAEIALEHNLGLTCDPVFGLVQIPCIERNTMGAIKAINATFLALQGTGRHKVSLDSIIRVLKKTGDDMKSIYKETALGGIALEFDEQELMMSEIEREELAHKITLTSNLTEC